MNDIRNCRICGKIFNYVVGSVVCPRCKEKLEEKFQEVKKYIQDNHGADIPEVSEACDVDPAQIRQWIREDRLQFADDSPIMIPCEKCGKMIRSGRFCEQCKAEMTNTFRNAFTPDTKPVNRKTEGLRSERDRMRYL